MATPVSSPACDNCGAALVGPYCYPCGQRALEGGELTVKHALTSAADDVFHFESKTLRSIGLLFVPGLLTSRYLQGHRAPYTAPMKLYLAAAAIFFLCAPLAGFTLADMVATDTTGSFEKLVSAAMASKQMDPEVFVERFDVRLQSVYTAGLFVSVFATALLLGLLFRGQRRPYGAHVVFELHYVAFLYIFTIVLGIVGKPLGITGTPLAMFLGFAVILPYLFLALRRVYAESNASIAWKTAAVFVFALVFDSLVNLMTLVVTLKLV